MAKSAVEEPARRGTALGVVVVGNEGEDENEEEMADGGWA
jgi:hypothetical protein